MKARALCLALLSVGSLFGRAAAAAPGGVGLTLSDCPGLDEHALREHLQLELVTLQLEHADATLRVRCEAGAATIELERAQSGLYAIQVRVELRDTARAARERLLALAATELLAQAERARPSEGPRQAAPLPRASTAPTTAAARDVEARSAPQGARHRPVELFVAGSVALDGSPKTALWGGSLGTLIGLGRSWSLLFDTRFERGALQTQVASVRWSVLSGFAGPAARLEIASLQLAAGVGLRAGWLALDATAQAPHDGFSLTAPWAGLAVPVRLSMQLAGGVVPFFGLEAGYVLLPVRGNVSHGNASTDAPLVQQRGPWFSGSAGLGVAL